MSFLTISNHPQSRYPLSSVETSNSICHFTDLIGKIIQNYQGYSISFKTMGDRLVCTVEKDNVIRENVLVGVLADHTPSEQASMNPRLVTFDLFSRYVILGESGLKGGGCCSSKQDVESTPFLRNVPINEDREEKNYQSVQGAASTAISNDPLRKAFEELDQLDDSKIAHFVKTKLIENGYLLIESTSVGRETWEKEGCNPINFSGSLDIHGAKAVIKKIYSNKPTEQILSTSSKESPQTDLKKEKAPFSEIRDFEGEYYTQFEKAYENGEVKEQIFYLEQLGEFFLKKRDYTNAAHLFNQALAATQRYGFDVSEQERLLVKLEYIEVAFLQELGADNITINTGYLKIYRNHLQEIRVQIQEIVDEKKDQEVIQKQATKFFQILLADLIKNSISLLQETPPTSYAIIGFGSMAREEMCPYSDVEFGILIQEDILKNREYFRKLSRFLELRMINLGESSYQIVRPKKVEGHAIEGQSLTPHGFSFDTGGIAPLGKQGVYELIGSPDHFASFQKLEWIKTNDGEITLVNALLQGNFVFGDESLVKKYNVLLDKVLSEEEEISHQKGCQIFAKNLIRGHLKEFEPWLNSKRIDLRAFDVKRDLYRPIQMMIGALSLYYEIEGNNTLKNIAKLEEKGVFGKEGAQNLTKVFSIALQWRTQAHFFYGCEKEIFYHLENDENYKNTDLLSFSRNQTEILLELYQILIPFNKGIKEFIEGDSRYGQVFPPEDIKILSSKSFYDETVKASLSLQTLGVDLTRLPGFLGKLVSNWDTNLGVGWNEIGFDYSTSLQDYERLYSLNPNDVSLLGGLSRMHLRQRNFSQALSYAEKHLSCLEKIYSSVATRNLGEVSQNRYYLKIKHKAALNKTILADIGICFYIIATAHAFLKNRQMAEQVYILAYTIYESTGKNYMNFQNFLLSPREINMMHFTSQIVNDHKQGKDESLGSIFFRSMMDGASHALQNADVNSPEKIYNDAIFLYIQNKEKHKNLMLNYLTHILSVRNSQKELNF